MKLKLRALNWKLLVGARTAKKTVTVPLNVQLRPVRCVVSTTAFFKFKCCNVSGVKHSY